MSLERIKLFFRSIGLCGKCRGNDMALIYKEPCPFPNHARCYT